MPVHFVVVAAMGGVKTLSSYAVAFALVTPVAWLSFRLIEVPARVWLNARLLDPDERSATDCSGGEITDPALAPQSRPI
jgi:peptidoglycan/LPS O-acetylase OafA/YrhL